jgi:hypothetical protein
MNDFKQPAAVSPTATHPRKEGYKILKTVF